MARIIGIELSQLGRSKLWFECIRREKSEWALSEEIGLGPGYLCNKIHSGGRMTQMSLTKICKYFNKSCEYFVNDEWTPDDPYISGYLLQRIVKSDLEKKASEIEKKAEKLE